MRWLSPITLMLIPLIAGPSSVRAGEVAKARSMDELMVTAEIARRGDFVAWGFDALWMMTRETAVHENGKWKQRGPTLVRVDGKSNKVEDNEIREASANVRGLATGEGAVWIPTRGPRKSSSLIPSTKRPF